MIYNVYLALGSNVGDREENLISAIQAISRLSQTKLEGLSNIFETDPVGYLEQDRFLNMTIAVKTELEPVSLLEQLQNIEIELKRTRKVHWGPRTIDIDILVYGDIKINLPQLIVPHPRMFERAFVLIPLREIYQSEKLFEIDFDKLLIKCPDRGGIKIYKAMRSENGKLIF